MLKDQKLRAQPLGTEDQIRIVWDDASPEQWNDWMVKAGRSNLPQSWAWGESKSTDSGWRVKRGVFFRGAEAIAFVQLLEKSVAGILHISRINRGPVFLEPSNFREVKQVWNELSSLGNIFRGKVLTVAPELALSGSYLLMMARLGFRQFSPQPWESVWVDLRLESSELRKRLNGKWRNALLSAEKHGLRLEAGTDDTLFDWMMERYTNCHCEQGSTSLKPFFLLAVSSSKFDRCF